MMHRRTRAFFFVATLLGALATGAAASAALTPRPVPVLANADFAIAHLSSLRERVPMKIVVPDLSAVEAKARTLRQWSYLNIGVIRSSHSSGVPIYLVRDGDGVRGFIGIDPRNGCDLELIPNPYTYPVGTSVFHDICHGSLYAVDGSHVGGPSPFTLDELVITVADDLVYASRTEVIPGHLIYPR